ncbi:glycosyltransferase family 2 protein [Algoriphagus marincola]|uniref:glycosyltransferase family 2 protein n=1 Tax=Algoriphagus marincola TaxID=264027 RepID=UPI00040600F8|nr:glycosyltransferase family A protein [Algoriphagus marincola]
MESQNPFFSIIIPIYNSSHTLKRVFLSIQNQSFKNWELIFVNDGSTDDSEKIVYSFIEDKRVSYIFQENSGVSTARNRGVLAAKSNWLIFLDSDDELSKTALRNFFESLKVFPNELVLLAGFKRIREGYVEDLVFIPSKEKKIKFLSGAFIISRCLFNKLKGYDSRFTFGENSELFRRINYENIIPKQLSFVSLLYHDKPVGGSKNMKNMEYSTRLLLEKHADYFDKNLKEKRVYLQIIGVCNLRLGNYSKAKEFLYKAYKIDCLRLDTLVRLIISQIPFLSRKVYPLSEYR